MEVTITREKGETTTANAGNGRRMSRDPVRSKMRREQLFYAIARQIIMRRGSLTLDEIAARMGMSKGTIYYYFKSKADMLYKMWMHLYDLEMKQIQPVLDDNRLGDRERLEGVVRAFVLTNCWHWHLARALSNDLAIREATPAMATVINRRTGQLAATLRQLAEKMNAAEGAECRDSRIMGSLLMGYMTSVSKWYKGTGRLSAEEVAEHAVRLVSDGFPGNRRTTREPHRLAGPECETLAEGRTGKSLQQ